MTPHSRYKQASHVCQGHGRGQGVASVVRHRAGVHPAGLRWISFRLAQERISGSSGSVVKTYLFKLGCIESHSSILLLLQIHHSSWANLMSHCPLQVRTTAVWVLTACTVVTSWRPTTGRVCTLGSRSPDVTRRSCLLRCVVWIILYSEVLVNKFIGFNY